MEGTEKLVLAEDIMLDFAKRTGLIENGDQRQRYLWTDAFAVHAFFGLAKIKASSKYKELALELIDLTHQVLGRYRNDDPREGWISGLSEKEGKLHPTSGGLRIGKKLPERQMGESYDARLEWGRDGQYYHYLTKWIDALTLAYEETKDQKYANWAAELILVSDQFIEKNKGRMRMYWKMSTDLSRPLVESMGAQDALEGGILARKVKKLMPDYSDELQSLINQFDHMCRDRNWTTTDPLGIGGLLLNMVKVLHLNENELIEELKADQLLNDAERSLQLFKAQYSLDQEAFERLPFRECGLSLGLRVVHGLSSEPQIRRSNILSYSAIADEIEHYWTQGTHQKVHTWQEHMNINGVSLACSLIANKHPEVFS